MHDRATFTTLYLFASASRAEFARTVEYSGMYSVAMSLDMTSTTDTVMAALGAVVVVHGLAFLTPLAARIGRADGPLMLAYSLLMLGNQALMCLSASRRWDAV